MKALQTPSEHSARNQEVAALIGKAAAGDQQAVSELYDATSRMVYGLVLRILGDEAVAEEVMLDVYMQVWRQASLYDVGRGAPLAWLATIARSRAIDRLRAVDSRERAAQRSAEDAPPDAAPHGRADEDAISAERAEAVRDALGELPEEQRQVLLLAYLEGMSQSEIAAAKNQPLGTVKTRTRTGLKKLGDTLRARLGRQFA